MLAGLAVLAVGQKFDSVGAAVWWAFLRLTDPGYLGDDIGAWQRFVSTLLTVSGYVVFMGTLVAILTRWLIAKMEELERGPDAGHAEKVTLWCWAGPGTRCHC
ncbi:MAG: hypothetical protein MH219_12130 [Marinobacter sp.]|nr:hypothetical protein [Marinobacter sp.]